MTEPDRSDARRLAAEALAQGDAIAWFDKLYRAAEGNASAIPWADGAMNPNLARWLEARPLAELGQRTLVVGCGLGDDAEALAQLGLAVTAFDVSATAIQWCRRRFPQSTVEYGAADLLNPPAAWRGAFDFVLEAYTLQVLPAELAPRPAGTWPHFWPPAVSCWSLLEAATPRNRAATCRGP